MFKEYLIIASEIGDLMCTKGCMVTDCEIGFRNAIKRYLPSMPLFRCWNHFWSSTDAWIRKHNGTMTDVRFYCDSLRQILQQQTVELCHTQIEKSKNGYTTDNGQEIPPWSTSFVDYFEKDIRPELEALAAYLKTK